MKKTKRLTALITAAAMFISCLSANIMPLTVYSASVNTVYIETAEDLISLSANCRLDSWSKGKTVVLKKDIILSDTKFTSIPSFSGVFDGGGHTVSGLEIKYDGAAEGFFRYVEEGALVKDLNVTGNVSPSGTSEAAGGIAGVNRGTIHTCSFSGAASGSGYIGGIAGVNEETGLIVSCTSGGRIRSSHYTGGITGENRGVIIRCTNNAKINTTIDDASLDIESIDMSDFRSTENVADITDAGGIAGYSSGSVQSCVNNGAVGYPHVGYNIGGIAGRHSGYISGCTNNGVINGRKDIGGIVGQSEPYSSLLFSEKTVNKLRTELDSLSDILGRTINDADEYSSEMSAQTDKIIDSIENAKSSADELFDKTDKLINDNIDSINEISARFSDAIDMAEPVFDAVSESSSSVKEAFRQLQAGTEQLEYASDSMTKTIDTLFPALDSLSEGAGSLTGAAENLSGALESLRQSLGDPDKTRSAVENLKLAMSMFSEAVQGVFSSVGMLSSALSNLSGSDEINAASDRIREDLIRFSDISSEISSDIESAKSSLDSIALLLDSNVTDPEAYSPYISDVIEIFANGSVGEMFDILADINEALGDIIGSEALSGMKDDITKALQEINRDIDAAEGAAALVNDQLSRLGDSYDVYAIFDVISYLKSVNSDIGGASSSAQDIIAQIQQTWPSVDDTSAAVIAALYCTEEAASNAADAAGSLKEAADGIGDMIDYFSSKDDIVFVGTDDDFRGIADALSAAMDDIGSLTDVLNGTAGASSSVLLEDIRMVNDQLSVVMDILLDMAEEFNSTDTEISDYVQDISSSDTNSMTEGKIASCVNMSEINGDINVGGITGSMAVEYDFDPEDDIDVSGNASADFMYNTRTVVRDCINYGSVTSKKDCAGGIVGEMKTGCVINGGSFGKVSSAGGSYVGGIAGSSEASVYGSDSKCMLSGESYVGGIAGSGHDIYNCRAFVDISGASEYYGAVVGSCDGELSANIFVSDTLGGVDGVSYSGKAAPVSYEKMMASASVPGQFGKMYLTFIADDKVIDSISVPYGGEISEDMMPEIPEKEGYTAAWDKFDMENITFDLDIEAVYTKYVTALAGEYERENGLSVMLCEGMFTEGDTLTLTKKDISFMAKGTKDMVEQWGVRINSDGMVSHNFRYLPPEGAKNIQIYQYKGDKWVPVESEPDGSYYVFAVDGTEALLAMTGDYSDPKLVIIISAGAGALAVLIILLIIRRRRKAKRVRAVPNIRNDEEKILPEEKVK
ncbi:MAG: hypothetical protein ACI4JJ_07230 [Huintestinicola sp.]